MRRSQSIRRHPPTSEGGCFPALISARLAEVVVFLSLIVPGNQAVAEGESDSNVSEAFIFTTGLMSYSQKGIDPKTGRNTKNMAGEWMHFAKKDVAPFIGYRLANDSQTNRTLYQAGFAGVRVFPLTLGLPVRGFRNLSLVDYDFPLKPYIEVGASLGRYLITTMAQAEAFDASSEFYGVALGAGGVFGFGERYALDLRFSYEYARGYGPLVFSASTIFALLGFMIYM